MKKRRKTSLSIGKIAIITIILITLCGLGRIVIGTQVNNVTIVLSDNCELNIVTTKTKISEILEENHIVVLDEETVTPSKDKEIGEDKIIKISKNNSQVAGAVQIAEETEEIQIDQILEEYTPIVEKIVKEEEIIPYETITKDISGNSEQTKNKVIQEGKDGLKIVTYKIRYKNDIEVERTKIKEEIINEPVEKIIQVQNVKTTSRSATTSRNATAVASANLGVYKVTAYCSCAKCCGKTNGITASGKKATANHTVAAPASFAIGTKLLINGKEYTVEDRGGAITGNKIDVYMNSHAEALAWGVKYLTVQVVK